jgi:hypothetical protein
MVIWWILTILWIFTVILWEYGGVSTVLRLLMEIWRILNKFKAFNGNLEEF